jgi:hypothetical protein
MRQRPESDPFDAFSDTLLKRLVHPKAEGHMKFALFPITSHRVATFSVPRSAYGLGVVLTNTAKSS